MHHRLQEQCRAILSPSSSRNSCIEPRRHFSRTWLYHEDLHWSHWKTGQEKITPEELRELVRQQKVDSGVRWHGLTNIPRRNLPSKKKRRPRSSSAKDRHLPRSLPVLSRAVVTAMARRSTASTRTTMSHRQRRLLRCQKD